MSTKYLELEHGKIAYDDSGSGPLVVGVPSMGDLRDEYRFLIPQLVNAGYRVVNMDVRGMGETSVEWDDYTVAGVGADIVALIRDLEVGPAIVIGTSMAAGAAVWAAAEAPELVRGMVLVGPFVRGEGTWFSNLLYSTLFTRPWGATMWLKYFSTLYPTRKPEDFAEYTSVLKANLTQPGRLESLVEMIRASKRASEERIPQVDKPVLVLMGSKDPDFKDTEAEAKWVADNLKGTYTMIEGAGHYPHAEMPEITAPLMLEFMKSLNGN
jgi:pimeloyl-ACP methyl ester carboxylesterase